MNKLKEGQLVISKAGRDKGKIFVIISLEEEYVYLVDGVLRRLEKPKRKKIKHIQPTSIVDELIEAKLNNNQKMLNAEFRKTIQLYKSQLGV